jgi:hypothetical protein
LFDKQTVLKEEDQAASQEAKYWQDKPDVLEVPSRQVDLSERPKLRYGTVGDGMDLARMVRPHGEHVVAIEKSDLSSELPGHSKPSSTYLTGRVPSKLLGRSKLDCLLVDGDNINWLTWLNDGKKEAAPSTIIWMVSEQVLLEMIKLD